MRAMLIMRVPYTAGMCAYRPVCSGAYTGRVCSCAHISWCAHACIPNSFLPAVVLMRGYQPRIPVPAAYKYRPVCSCTHTDRVYRPVCSCAHTGHVYWPICSCAHTKLVDARISTGVHRARMPADYNDPTTSRGRLVKIDLPPWPTWGPKI